MVVHPGKTKSMVLASRQKHQLQPLMLNLTLCTHINEQVREHSVLGITIDEEIKWQPYIDNVCKQVARILCLLGRLRKYVDTDRRKLFFNAHLLAHINYASIALSNASEVHFKKKKINSFYRRAAIFILPDHSLSTTAKLQKSDILLLLYNTVMLMFKVHMGWAPQCECDLLHRAPAQYE